MPLIINSSLVKAVNTNESNPQDQARKQGIEEEPIKWEELNNSAVKNDEKAPDDDGKVSFLDGAKSFFSGMFNKAKEQVTSIVDNVKENPVPSALAGVAVAGVGVLCALFPPIAVGVGVVGAGIGAIGVIKEGKEIYNNIKDLSESDTDEQTLKILEEMGGNATEATESALFTVTSAAAAFNGVRATSAMISAEDAFANTVGTTVTREQEIELTYQFLKEETAFGTLNKTMFADGIAAEGVVLDKFSNY